MITLPDFKKKFDYENAFYLSCEASRIGKAIAHYELFKRAIKVGGDIVECGVFKGASLSRFAMYRELLGFTKSKKLIGFDIFGKFPQTKFQQDQAMRKRFIDSAGEESISYSQMQKVLAVKGLLKNVKLVKGDVTQTVPDFVKKNRGLKICMLNLDTDIYEPAVTILKYLYPRIVPGGVLILDDYGVFAGETTAVNEYFKGRKIKIRRFPFCKTPSYLIKE